MSNTETYMLRFFTLDYDITPQNYAVKFVSENKISKLIYIN